MTLSGLTGITRSVIANMENGRKDSPSIPELIALCAALQVHPVELIPELEAVTDDGLLRSHVRAQVFQEVLSEIAALSNR